MGSRTFGLLLGAGFSKWAVGLPVASELFDFAIEPWGPREQKKLEIVRLLKDAWDAGHPNGLSEQFIADALGFEERKKEAVLWYVVRRLSEPFVWKEFHSGKWRRHLFMIDENRRFDVPGLGRARRFLERLRRLSLGGIITTNYDLIVEYGLGTKGFNYGVAGERLAGRGAYPLAEWRNPVVLEGEVEIAKIHGSISWDEGTRYTNGRRGLTGNALIVAPTPQKKPPAGLRSVWQLAQSVLQRVSRLVVFGFAFNAYDEAVLNLLRSGGSNIESVILVDVEPKLERAARLWPGITVDGRDPPTDREMEDVRWRI